MGPKYPQRRVFVARRMGFDPMCTTWASIKFNWNVGVCKAQDRRDENEMKIVEMAAFQRGS